MTLAIQYGSPLDLGVGYADLGHVFQNKPGFGGGVENCRHRTVIKTHCPVAYSLIRKSTSEIAARSPQDLIRLLDRGRTRRSEDRMVHDQDQWSSQPQNSGNFAEELRFVLEVLQNQ